MRGGNEGPNWILLAGGAAITALSYVIGRRQKHGFEVGVDEREGKSGKAQLANHSDGFEPDNRDMESSKACSHQDPFDSVDLNELDNSTRAGLSTAPALFHDISTRRLDDAFQASNYLDRKLSFKSFEEDLTVQSPNSESGTCTPPLPSTEFSEFSGERSFQRNISTSQEDVRRTNQQGVQIGRTANRNMVHRLRKQLKSRDEMILSMQVQISEYERNLSVSDAHVSELQARLVETSGVVLDLDKEIQLLGNQLADLLKLNAKLEDCNQLVTGGAEFTTSCADERRDMNATLLELKKLREGLRRLKEETTAREIGRQALSQEYKLMLEKVDRLECALDEQGMLVSEKEQVLDMNKVELLRVTSKLQEIQHQLEAQVEEMESLRHSKGKYEACINNLYSRGFSFHELHSSEEIISSTSTEVSDSLSHLPEGRGDLELSGSCHEVEMDFAEDIKGPAVNDSRVAALLQEVEQLSTALASQSKVVTDQKEQTTRLVENLQVNELSIRLVDLVKCKQVEREMADVRIHQAKIVELQQKISNLTRGSIDEVRNEQTHHVASLICGLVEKLAAQEEQAKQTALEVQQLSESFQLLTPIVTKLQKEEADVPPKEESNLGDVGHVNLNSSSTHLKHTDQDCNIYKAGAPQPDQQDTDSSSDSGALSSNQQSPHYMLTELADDDYQFRVGASGPLATKIRRFSSKWDGKNGHRKRPCTRDYGSGSNIEKITSENEATNLDGEKDLYLHEHVDTDVPHANKPRIESNVEYQDSESRSIPVEEELKNNPNKWGVQQKNRYFSYEIEQVMENSKPDHEAVDFVPTFQEFSPPVRQVRSPRQGIGSSRRYLFNSGTTNQSGHAISLEALNEYLVTAAECPLEEESTSERSFSISEAASISPFSKMILQLNSKENLPANSSLQNEVLLPDSPEEVDGDETGPLMEAITLRADKSKETEDIGESETNTPIANEMDHISDESEANTLVVDSLIETQNFDDLVSESGSETRDSIDSEFDEMLDGTLDDLVKIFSTSVTPSGTPTSSILSQNSGSKKLQYF